MLKARWVVLALLAACTTVSASTESIDVQGVVTVRGTTDLDGQLALVVAAAGLVVADVDELRNHGLRLEGDNMIARLINAPLEIVSVRTPAGTLVNTTRAGDQTTLAEQPVPGAASLLPNTVAAGQPALHRVLGAAGAELEFQINEASSLHLAPPAPLDPQTDGGVLGHVTNVGGHPLGNQRLSMRTSMPGTESWTLESRYAAILLGGEVRLGTGDGAPTWKTGRFLNHNASTYDPVTGTGRYVYDYHVLVIEADRGHAWAAGGLNIAATRVNGQLNGQAAWAGVDADLLADGERLPYDPELLLLGGNLVLQASIQDRHGSWYVEGPVHLLAADGVTWFQAPQAVALALTTALALFLSLLTDAGRSLLTFLVGRSTPGLVKAKPLDNQLRRQMLRVIHERQPIRQTDLIDATGASKTTVAYHLRILLAHDILQTELDKAAGQRNTTFMLNSNSMHFVTQGVASFLGIKDPADAEPTDVVASRALAAINSSPLRRAMFKVLQENGPLDFASLKEKLLAGGQIEKLPQSSASHHLQQLVAAGALGERRVNRRKVYAVNINPDAVRATQYKRFLQQEDALDVVACLQAHGPATREELRQRFTEQGLPPRKAASRVTKARQLARMHILHLDQDGRYQPAAFLKNVSLTNARAT